MGGRNVPNCERLTLVEYERLGIYLLNTLHNLGIQTCQRTFTYTQKTTFGDIDIIILMNPDAVIHELINKIQQSMTFSCKPKYNGNIVSLGIIIPETDKIAQVDLCITYTPSHYEMMCFTSGYSVFGQMIGIALRYVGLLISDKMLAMRVSMSEDDYENNFKILCLSNNPKEIMEFLHLDYTEFMAGFCDEEHLYNFAIKSPYVHRQAFIDHIGTNKEKCNKRMAKIYALALTGEDLTFERHTTDWKMVQHVRRQMSRRNALEFFHKEKEKETIVTTLKNQKIIRLKCNGIIFQRISGRKGKDLGTLLKQFREIYTDTEILHMTPETVENNVKKLIHSTQDIS